MLNTFKALAAGLLLLLLAVQPGQAVTVTATIATWDSTPNATIKFGKRFRGGGKSTLTLGTALNNPIVTLSYYNAVNAMRCGWFGCRTTRAQKRWFSVFDGGVLVSRAIAKVRTTINPRGDYFSLKVKYLASGYNWTGTGRRRVCERCTVFAQLYRTGPNPNTQNNPTPSPVPLPPALALMGGAVSGLFGFSRLRRKKKAA